MNEGLRRKTAALFLLACGLAASLWLAWPSWRRPPEKTGFSRAPGTVALPCAMPGGRELLARKLRVRFSFRLPSKDTSAALFQSAPERGLDLVAAEGKLLLEASHREALRGGEKLVAGPFAVDIGALHRAELFYEGDNLRFVLDDRTLAATTYPYFNIRITAPVLGITQAEPAPEISNVEVTYSAVPVLSRPRWLSGSVFAIALACVLSAAFLFFRRRGRA